MRVFVAGMMVAFSLCAWGCVGSADSGGNPVTPAPTPTPTPTGGVVTIAVVGENGAQSFSPNPATLPAGQTVVWRNVDRITHRVVLTTDRWTQATSFWAFQSADGHQNRRRTVPLFNSAIRTGTRNARCNQSSAPELNSGTVRRRC